MNRNNAVIAAVLLIVAGMLFAGRYLRKHTRTAHGNPVTSAVGAEAPDFTLKTVDGKQVRLSDYRGKAVLLNFWATWCGPCKMEIPWFLELEKQYQSKGLVILGVAMDDDNKDKIGDFAKDMKIDYPVLLGTDAVADNYGGVEGLPTTFYIGRDGRILKHVEGVISEGEIEQNIQAALSTSASNVQAENRNDAEPQPASSAPKER